MGKETKTKYINMYMYCILFWIFIIFVYLLFHKELTFYTSEKEYNSITELTSEQLLKIRDYEKKKLDENFMYHFSLSFLKLARFPYDCKNYTKIPFKNFMNWDIINFGKTSKDNYFVTFKNDSLKTIIISFPGTLEVSQLIEEALGSTLINFKDNDTINEKILIGKYFGERAKNLFEIIFNKELDDLMQKNYEIISTGHSLGGAMAQSFMYFALIKGKIKKENLPKTITYGQPKVGNFYFADFLDKNTFLNLRFVNKNDVVQYIPFTSGILNHIKYFFNINDLQYTYYHTKNENEQRKVIVSPYFIIILSFLFKVAIFNKILSIIFSPILKLCKQLYLMWPLKKKWDEYWNMKDIVKFRFFIKFFVLILLILFLIKAISIKNSILLLIFEFLIISILLYTGLILSFQIFFIINILINFGIQCGISTIKQSSKFICIFLYKLLELLKALIFIIYFPISFLMQHIIYQKNSTFEEIKDENEKNKVLKNIYDFPIYDSREFNIFKYKDKDKDKDKYIIISKNSVINGFV